MQSPKSRPARLRLGRDALDIDDLKWFFNEREGALGLKAQTYEPKASRDATKAGDAIADQIIEHRLEHVARERRIRKALELLHEDEGGPAHVRVLRRYVCPPRSVPAWAKVAFGDLAAVAMVTPTVAAYKANGWLDKIAQKEGGITKAKIRAEAHKLINEALRAYGQCRPNRKK